MFDKYDYYYNKTIFSVWKAEKFTRRDSFGLDVTDHKDLVLGDGDDDFIVFDDKDEAKEHYDNYKFDNNDNLFVEVRIITITDKYYIRRPLYWGEKPNPVWLNCVIQEDEYDEGHLLYPDVESFCEKYYDDHKSNDDVVMRYSKFR